MELRRTPARRAGLVAVAALLAFGASACAGGSGLVGTPPAATVNGHTISQSEVMDEASARRQAYQDTVDQGGDGTGDLATALQQLEGSGPDTVGAEGTARVLSNLIADEVIRQDLEKHDALPTKADREAARTALEQNDPTGQLKKLDKAFVDSLVESRALNTKFTQRAAEQANQDLKPYTDAERTAQKDELYEQNYKGIPLCLNAIQAQTEDEAAAAKKRVDGGEAFGAVAQEAAAAAGATISDAGLVICIPADQATQAFGTDFTTVAEGDVIGPVEYQTQSSTSYLVLKVESLDGLTREEAEPYLDAQVPAGPQQVDPTAYDSSAELTALIRKADVTVNPQYGRWSVAQSRVLPPVVPADPTATTAPERETSTSEADPAAGS